MPNTYWGLNWEKKKRKQAKDLIVIVYLLMFSCALKIVNKQLCIDLLWPYQLLGSSSDPASKRLNYFTSVI